MTLRHIASAENTFQATVGRGRNYGTLPQLASANLIDADLINEVKNGYRFIFSLSLNSLSYDLIARPVRFGTTGIRSFHIDERFIVRDSYAKNARISQMQPITHECGNFECCEAAAISIMRLIYTVQMHYQSSTGSGRRFGTLKQLLDDKLLDPTFVDGIKNGYRFRVRADPGSPTEASFFAVRAVPLEYRVTGWMSFYIDETGVVRGGDKGGAEAHSNDKILPCSY
jgi:hypothetical protein